MASALRALVAQLGASQGAYSGLDLSNPQDAQAYLQRSGAGYSWPFSKEQSAYLAAQFAPGAGMADASGAMPAMPEYGQGLMSTAQSGQFNPSMRQNLQQGNYLEAALQGLGALGDAAYAIPLAGLTVGNVLKAPRAIDKALDMSQAARMQKADAASAIRKIVPGETGFDPRFDPRVKEQERIATTEFRVEGEPPAPKEISIFDLEGQPFILGMADRTAGSGKLVGINDVNFDIPVENYGGQDFMFRTPGAMWASDKGPVSAMMNRARTMSPASMLGGVVESPLFLPFRMAPTGGDYATMTTDAMLTYARNNMTKKTIRSANKDIKQVFPEFLGIENPESMAQLAQAGGNVRKAVQQVMDKKYRDLGGLNIGQARLSVTDPAQYTAMDLGLSNVGRIDPYRQAMADSMHPTYSRAIPGEGLGTLKERDISAFELLPGMVRARNVDIANPDPKDIYTLRLGVQGGRITDEMLRAIEARRGM